MGDTIWKDICAFEKIFPTRFPGNLQITRNIKRNKAKLLLNIVNNQSLIHDINRPIRNQLLQIIRKRLPSQIEPLNPVIKRKILKNWSTMCEREPTINNKTTLGFRHNPIRVPTGLVEMNQRWRIRHIQRPKIEVLEHKLEQRASN
uniref:Uncharacterized protein n=1 Tax=Opuntia streptacantha TaxID=393608 RepID=A0A7C8ZIZ2_OPUST